jgi:SAM-dependent methyltransferase
VAELPEEVRERFASVFSQPPSAVQARIWASVLGDEYPAEVQPYSYVTRSELARYVDVLQVGDGATLVDVGCGHGGPGLWVCAATGANLVGVDISEPALAASAERARGLGLGDRATYRLGNFAELPLADGEADAVMSIDSLVFAPDKAAAAAELARVLRPGGRLAFTTWDYSSQPPNRPPQVADHRPVLTEAGFDVVEYTETEGWREGQAAIDSGLLASVDELAAESGEDPAAVAASVAEMHRTMDHMLRRVFVVAIRR